MRSLIGLLLVALATGTNAQERVEPARGTLLVARSEITGGPFFHSVVLLLAHGPEGTLGVIVNRPTEVPLSEAIPGLDGDEAPPPLFFGGPVALDGLLVVFRSEKPLAGATEVVEDLYFSGERKVLERLLEEDRPQDAWRLFIGHSGWAPNQLEAELQEGSWNVLRTNLSTLFRSKPEWMWDLLQEGGGTIAGTPGTLGPRGLARSFASPWSRPGSRQVAGVSAGSGANRRPAASIGRWPRTTARALPRTFPSPRWRTCSPGRSAGGEPSPTSTSSTRRRPPSFSRKGSSAPPRRG